MQTGYPKAKRVQVVHEMRKRILNGRYPPGHRLPVITELADHFDISSVTMQRAVDQLVTEGFLATRRRGGTSVVDAPPHLGRYALVIPASSTPGVSLSVFYAALLRAAQGLTLPSGSISSYLATDNAHDLPTMTELGHEVRLGRLSGLILGGAPGQFSDESLFHQDLVPLVGIMQSPLSSQVPAVYPDELGLWNTMLSRLRERGRRRVAVITPGGYVPEIMARIARAGLQTADYLIQIPSITPPAAEHAARLLMRLPEGDRPDALIVSDDNLVESATLGLAAMGRRIPDELTVIAHCNFPELPRAAVRCEFVGFRAADILTACVRVIDAARAGEPVSPLTLVPAVSAGDVP